MRVLRHYKGGVDESVAIMGLGRIGVSTMYVCHTTARRGPSLSESRARNLCSTFVTEGRRPCQGQTDRQLQELSVGSARKTDRVFAGGGGGLVYLSEVKEGRQSDKKMNTQRALDL